jgi:glycosyltransferase involved in cell wall biosynthesis
MKTKVLFFLSNLHGGGAERVAVNLLRKLDPKRFDVSLAMVDKTGDYIDLIPEHVTVYDLKARKTAFSLLRLRKVLKALEPDIVFATLFHTAVALYLSIATTKKRPLLVLRSPNSPKLVLANRRLHPIKRFLLEKAYKSADLILAQTPEMKEEIVKYHHIQKDKIRVFFNPLDTELIDQKIQKIENPFKTDQINVVAAGKLSRQKGFDVLIKAFRRVVDENSDFVLHIIGRGRDEKENLQKLVSRLHLEESVNFLGFQKNPYRFFFYSDLYVLPSRWEGLPNTVLENLYLKKPIIATRCIPSLERLIKDGQNGILVDVEDSEQLADAILSYRKLDADVAFPLQEGDINQTLMSLIT